MTQTQHSSTASSPEAEAALQKQAWDYFSLHSGQRIATFNYFIGIATLLSGAFVSTFQKDFTAVYMRPVLGILLMLFAYVFRKLDSRNRELIKYSEAALRHFEERSALPSDNGRPHPAMLFSREEWDSRHQKRESWSYTQVFNAVLWAFFAAGLVGTVVSLWMIWA